MAGCWGDLVAMNPCSSCHSPATNRDGYDAAGRQRYHCRPCHRDFTVHSISAFSGYRWPPNVILMAVRWYCSLPLSAQQVMQLLAERHIDVSARTVLNWVQTFGPQLAAALRTHRRRVGRRWTVDEVFCFRGTQKLYLYRAVDEHGQVIDVLLRDKRDRAAMTGGVPGDTGVFATRSVLVHPHRSADFPCWTHFLFP